jgi:hypothetical protein
MFEANHSRSAEGGADWQSYRDSSCDRGGSAVEAVAAPAGYSRPLGIGDLGITGSIGQLKGTFTLRGSAPTVSIDMIEGSIQNPFQIIRNIADTARKAGATSLRIQVTIANETLYEVLKSVTV